MSAPTTPDLDLAVPHHLRGGIEGAEAGYRSVLEATPDNATALNNLGFAAAQSGRFEEAAALYERAIAVDDRAGLHRAFALREVGRTAEANDLLRLIADTAGEYGERARKALADDQS